MHALEPIDLPTHRPCEQPVLLITFNRPETTRQVFEAIRLAAPARLYIASDGPRAGRPEEAERVEEVRALVHEIDWPCTVQTRFLEENRGCRLAVSSAITWFFEQESEGIILEDDTVPNRSFFAFCERMLDRYRDDHRVYHVSGYQHLPDIPSGYDYYFSAVPGIWGWASWADRWSTYQVDLPRLSAFDPPTLSHAAHRRYWDYTFRTVGAVDTWDYQWTYAIMRAGAVAIRPQVNLVTNIGFGADATHTTRANAEIAANVGRDIARLTRIPTTVAPAARLDYLFYKRRLRGHPLRVLYRYLHHALLR